MRYDVTFKVVIFPTINVEAEDELDAEGTALEVLDIPSEMYLEHCRAVKIVPENDEEYHTETRILVYQTV